MRVLDRDIGWVFKYKFIVKYAVYCVVIMKGMWYIEDKVIGYEGLCIEKSFNWVGLELYFLERFLGLLS